jgi:hypothetical protein
VAEYLSARGYFRTSPFRVAFRVVFFTRIHWWRPLCGRGQLPTQCLNESGRLQYSGLHIKNCVCDTVRINDGFTQKRHGSVAWRIDFADYAPEIEFEVGFELAGKLPHSLIVSEAMHLQRLDARFARSKASARATLFHRDSAKGSMLSGFTLAN